MRVGEKSIWRYSTIWCSVTVCEHIYVVRDMLKAGVLPSQADFNLVPPLYTVVKIGNVEMTELLSLFGHPNYRLISLCEVPYDWTGKAG